MIGVLFWTLTILGCGYAVAEGGRDGRWATLMIISASFLTIPVGRMGNHWMTTEWGLFAVDAALFASLYWLALRSRRHFPIWMAGFQLISASSHLATLLAPRFTPNVYRGVETFWAVPVTLSMIIGVVVDRRGLREL